MPIGSSHPKPDQSLVGLPRRGKKPDRLLAPRTRRQHSLTSLRDQANQAQLEFSIVKDKVQTKTEGGRPIAPYWLEPHCRLLPFLAIEQ